jgi:hypothetical protein
VSGIGLCDGLITRAEDSYQEWCVIMSDLQTHESGGLGPSGAILLTNLSTAKTFGEHGHNNMVCLDTSLDIWSVNTR